MTASIDAAGLDIELSPKSSTPPHLDGYPSFADFIARHSDAAIYRRFEHLSARNLLYLQSELHGLQEQLQNLDLEDAADLGNVDAQKAARELRYMRDSTNPRARLHIQLQNEIRAKLKEYRMSREPTSDPRKH